MPFARALLGSKPQFRSRDVDETRAFFASFGVRFEPIGSNWALDVRLNGGSLPGFYTVYVQSGAAALRAWVRRRRGATLLYCHYAVA